MAVIKICDGEAKLTPLNVGSKSLHGNRPLKNTYMSLQHSSFGKFKNNTLGVCCHVDWCLPTFWKCLLLPYSGFK